MAGLVPAIHAVTAVTTSRVWDRGATWMAGTSPAMTTLGCIVSAGAIASDEPDCRQTSLAMTSLYKRSLVLCFHQGSCAATGSITTLTSGGAPPVPPLKLPETGLASAGVRVTAILMRCRSATSALVGSNSIQPSPGT